MLMQRFRLVLGLPVELQAALKVIAQREHRSVSAQIVHWLQEAVARDRAIQMAEAGESP
jgi:hypothetical protein